MTFEQLLEGAEIIARHGDSTVRGIAYDSRKVKQGYVFVAMRGGTSDGNRFIDQAIAAGASACDETSITTSVAPLAKPCESISFNSSASGVVCGAGRLLPAT